MREKIYKIVICPYSSQLKLKRVGGFILFFLNGLLLEGKSMSLHKSLLLFRCVFEAKFKVKSYSRISYKGGGPIMDVRVG
jgi:hypothetical protein